MRSRILFVLLAVTLAACAEGGLGSATGDLPLGEVLAGSDKSDWGYALDCKPIPDLPRLTNPEIHISLHGLSLRLVDKASGFEKVFPVGVGTINNKSSELTYGESLSWFPAKITRRDTFTLYTSKIQPCRTWWTDSDTGERIPVFAGLPFMPFYGGYAIHGPVDNYKAANGGNLRRGFVSHGCIRMEAADVAEVYARIRGVSSLPVRLTREPERTPAGKRVDTPQKWIGAECRADGDCDFSGGFCKQNRYSGRGFCSIRCSRYCPDKAGQPVSFCVPDPDDSSAGMCLNRTEAMRPDCRELDHFTKKNVSRNGQSWVRRDVCYPSSPGWVGDHCFANADCTLGTVCRGASAGKAGICSMSCSRYCSDKPGWAVTFCIDEPSLSSGGSCVRQCDPANGAPECPADSECVARSRKSQSSVVKTVCIPK